MKSNKEQGSKISFINILNFIECGESANITINNNTYNISLKDEVYYIDTESYSSRENFIKALSEKSSIPLSDDSLILLNSIADGKVKVDSSWNLKNTTSTQNHKEKKKPNLYSALVIKQIILYIFIIILLYIILKRRNISSFSNLFIFSSSNNNFLETLYILEYNIVSIILIIATISIGFFKENRIRLQYILKYTKNYINKIAENVITHEKDTIFFNTGYRAFFSNQELLLVRKTELKIINYENIVCVLDSINTFSSFTRYKEHNVYILTKDKQIISLGDSSHKNQFKKKLLEKNSNIVFSKPESKNQIITINSKQINAYKFTIKIKFKIFLKIITILLLLYLLINQTAITNLSILAILFFILCALGYYMLDIYLTYSSYYKYYNKKEKNSK